jgi:Na+-transporting NADH:ubiquinone oxidoreductase subunit F
MRYTAPPTVDTTPRDGLCTHGNAHLADGLVKGTDHRMRQAQWSLRYSGWIATAPASLCGPKNLPRSRSSGEIAGRFVLRLGDIGVTHAAPLHTVRVVSNLNVTPYIKELVLEPVDGSQLLAYQPGDYLQFDIPAYAERSLRDLEIDPLYTAAWLAQGLTDLTVSNSVPSRRSYSMTGNPAADKNLRFNIRIATPPPGLTVPAGIASTYLFGLKPGEIVTAIGPFGAFHVSETEREKVYLGGGSGMAPLRSHLSYLLETCMSTARISYWFGARTRQEVYYQDYFEELAAKHPNFSFHVVLSDALPEDNWHSYTGFVHAALKSAYLDSHPESQKCRVLFMRPAGDDQSSHLHAR